ncbi:hypothetical protein CBR_g24285 [Chara braunii]|uniref:Adenylate kinase isoenzyme 6 homolog n=1 Tax=Chara braunii TaxID=69332 RepID=A0A388JMF1_CHABU|nr:hypothetical protein CBR_g24285 [Chara braunii]|eukprot:GBG58933.1 hypothetical protein CBR_g24285 [Chara braunii]
MASNRPTGRPRGPNILVTGTPGCGKTSTSSMLANATGLRHINVGEFVRTNELHDGWDDEYSCYIVNEDKLCDELEDTMCEGGNIVDYHICEFFPERWFDGVVVLQTDNSVLYERLTARGYSGRKLSENMECEIMQVVLESARESYKPEIVMAMQSNTVEDMDRNVETLKGWIDVYARTRSVQ